MRHANDFLTWVIEMSLTGQDGGEKTVSDRGATYHSLFKALDQGVCVIEVLFENEQAFDYRFLETNSSFDQQSGLPHPQGKRMRELCPQHDQYWFDMYGRVALTGQAEHLQNHDVQLGRWYEVDAYRVGTPADHHVAVLVSDITTYKQTEQALQASEQRLRSIFEQLPAGVGVMDRTGAWLLTNSQIEELTSSAHPSQSTTDVTDPVWDVHGVPLSPEQWPSRRALRGETVIPAVEMHRADNTGDLWARVSAAPLRDHAGTIVGATTVVQNITSEKAAEQVLRRNAATFATLVEKSPLGIYSVDSQFRIRHVSAGAMPAFRNVQPLIGRDFAEVMHILWPDAFANEAIKIFRHTLETGEPYLSPGLTDLRKDLGAIESYEWQTIRITLADGQYGVVCYYFDTTRLQQANQSLRESEARFREMADNAPVMVWVTEPNGYCNFLGQSWYDFTGQAPDAGLGFGWIQAVHPDDRQHAQEVFMGASRRGESFRLEYRLRHNNGDYRWALDAAAPRRSESGEFLGYIGSVIDVTEQKGAEVALQEAQERLQQWNVQLEQAVNLKTAELVESQDRLRAMATELNLAEQRERQQLATELHDHLQQILVLGKLKMGQGKRLTSAMPALTRVIEETEAVFSEALQYTRTLVAELSPPVLRDHGLAAGLRWLGDYMKKHELSVIVHLPVDPLPPLPNDQDMMVFQSVRELLINCSKHAGTGQAFVTVEKRLDVLCITVLDHGSGFVMTPDVSTGALSSKFGLFSIRERMRGLGGSLHLESAPGKGTKAMLTLPLTLSSP